MLQEQIDFKKEMIAEMRKFIHGAEIEKELGEDALDEWMDEIFQQGKAELDFFEQDNTATVDMLFDEVEEYRALSVIYFATIQKSMDDDFFSDLTDEEEEGLRCEGYSLPKDEE